MVVGIKGATVSSIVEKAAACALYSLTCNLYCQVRSHMSICSSICELLSCPVACQVTVVWYACSRSTSFRMLMSW